VAEDLLQLLDILEKLNAGQTRGGQA